MISLGLIGIARLFIPGLKKSLDPAVNRVIVLRVQIDLSVAFNVQVSLSIVFGIQVDRSVVFGV